MSSQPKSAEISPSRKQGISVVGIHLAGAMNHRTAVVRATLATRRFFKRSPKSRSVSNFQNHFFADFVEQADWVDLSESERSPALHVSLLIDELGPWPSMSADDRLSQALRDLEPADFYILDAPLTQSACQTCELICPGFRQCPTPAGLTLQRLWEIERKKSGRTSGRVRVREPQPYLERPFEFSARHLFQRTSLMGEWEPVEGSNRAPLGARARFLRKRILSIVPNARVVEGLSVVGALARARDIGLSSASASEIKSQKKGLRLRKRLLEVWMERRELSFGAHLHSLVRNSFFESPEAFFALQNALLVRDLAIGNIFVQEDLFLDGLGVEDHPLVPDSIRNLYRELEDSAENDGRPVKN